MQEKGIVNLRKDVAKIKERVKAIEEYLELQAKFDEDTARAITKMLDEARKKI